MAGIDSPAAMILVTTLKQIKKNTVLARFSNKIGGVLFDKIGRDGRACGQCQLGKQGFVLACVWTNLAGIHAPVASVDLILFRF